jgi:hypothetical protein
MKINLLLARMPKIFLQQYRHFSAPPLPSRNLAG